MKKKILSGVLVVLVFYVCASLFENFVHGVIMHHPSSKSHLIHHKAVKNDMTLIEGGEEGAEFDTVFTSAIFLAFFVIIFVHLLLWKFIYLKLSLKVLLILVGFLVASAPLVMHGFQDYEKNGTLFLMSQMNPSYLLVFAIGTSLILAGTLR